MALIVMLICGCQGKLISSKWAMDDPDYAAKYNKPYGDDKTQRMLKQAVDARHVEGKSGWYASGYGSGDPLTAGGELGIFSYPDAMVETRVGVMGLLGTRQQDWYVGLTPGIRLQTPTRFAPFVGVAGFIGGNSKDIPAEHDNIDNDGNGSVDEDDEVRSEGHFLGGISPEIGAHYWLTSSSRLTVSGQYLFTTEGRASDMWMFGLTFSVLTGPNKADGEASTSEVPTVSELTQPPSSYSRTPEPSSATATLRLKSDP